MVRQPDRLEGSADPAARPLTSGDPSGTAPAPPAALGLSVSCPRGPLPSEACDARPVLARRGFVACLTLLLAAGCGSGPSTTDARDEPDYYGKPGSAVAAALGCDWRPIPYDGSPSFDVAPTDHGLCTYPDGKAVGILTWPDEKALKAGVEVLPGAFSDYPAGDYYVSYGRGWSASGDDDLDRESAERPLRTLDGTLGHYPRLGSRATPSPVPFSAPSPSRS